MTAKPCRYCGFVAERMSDEDCPARPWWVRLLQYIRAWAKP